MVEAVEARFGTMLPARPMEWPTDNGYVARDMRRVAREIVLSR